MPAHGRLKWSLARTQRMPAWLAHCGGVAVTPCVLRRPMRLSTRACDVSRETHLDPSGANLRLSGRFRRIPRGCNGRLRGSHGLRREPACVGRASPCPDVVGYTAPRKATARLGQRRVRRPNAAGDHSGAGRRPSRDPLLRADAHSSRNPTSHFELQAAGHDVTMAAREPASCSKRDRCCRVRTTQTAHRG